MSQLKNHILSLFDGEQISLELPLTELMDGVFLPEYNLCIHCISLQQFKTFSGSYHYFSDLSNKAAQQKIRLIHLWEDIYTQYPQLVASRLLSFIKNRKRIHARKTTVVRIDKSTADAFLKQHHMQQSAKAYYKYALMADGKIAAVATFSKSRIMNDGPNLYRSYELIRFASEGGTTVVGGFNKLMQHFITQHHPAHIMTYADKDWGFGASYSKVGFKLVEEIPPHYFWLDELNWKRYPYASIDASLHHKYLLIMNAGSLKYVLDLRSNIHNQ